jgi:hypothetical protein
MVCLHCDKLVWEDLQVRSDHGVGTQSTRHIWEKMRKETSPLKQGRKAW